MEYFVKGSFNSGLKIYTKSSLVLYSDYKSSFFKPSKIFIYNNDKQLILTVKVSGFFTFNLKHKIEYCNIDLIEGDIAIDNGDLLFEVNNRLSLKNHIGFKNPIGTFKENQIKIGEIHFEKMISFNRNSKIIMTVSDDKAIYLSLILFLINSTIDYDDGYID